MDWMTQIEELARHPITAMLKHQLVAVESEISRAIAMRGGEAVTDDECAALLTVRSYLGQCDSLIPTPPPHIAPPPKPKMPRKPPMEPKSWELTMDPDEVEFCGNSIAKEVERIGAYFVDNHRAARMWVSSQRRRFGKQRDRGCCGSHDFVAQRWSPEKKRYDLYLLGFNYGH